MEACVSTADFQLTLQICASHKLEKLIEEDDRKGELQHHQPLLHIQVCELEDHLRTRAAPSEAVSRGGERSVSSLCL